MAASETPPTTWWVSWISKIIAFMTTIFMKGSWSICNCTWIRNHELRYIWPLLYYLTIQSYILDKNGTPDRIRTCILRSVAVCPDPLDYGSIWKLIEFHDGIADCNVLLDVYSTYISLYWIGCPYRRCLSISDTGYRPSELVSHQPVFCLPSFIEMSSSIVHTHEIWKTCKAGLSLTIFKQTCFIL